MKKFVILFIQMLPWLYCSAQKNSIDHVYLTNYTIGKESAIVGEVKVQSGEIKSVNVSGENSAAFKINKDNQLIVQPKKLKQGQQWFDVTLNVQTSKGKSINKFKIVKDDFIRNKVIAHRGAWKNTSVAENSIEALKHAIRLGCEGSEFDVHMSADSLPVVNHDPAIQGISIAKTNSQELLPLKLSHGETMPTLENYIKAGMEQNKTKLILEIKPSELGKESSIALTRKIVPIVERLGAQAWVDYISFDFDVCKEVMNLAPYARVSYLNGDKTPSELAAAKLFGLDYHFNVLKKNPEWIKEAKDKSLTINVWTVNEKPLMQELLVQQVDFITTNEPELLLSMVGRR
jgi:glycerophosphoryl diester phosphodiesterase